MVFEYLEIGVWEMLRERRFLETSRHQVIGNRNEMYHDYPGLANSHGKYNYNST